MLPRSVASTVDAALACTCRFSYRRPASRARSVAAMHRSRATVPILPVRFPSSRKFSTENTTASAAPTAAPAVAALNLDPDRVDSARACGGCGATLQSQDEALVGYVPAERERTGGRVVCQRCWRLTHHRTHAAYAGARPRLHRPELLAGIGARRCLVVCVVDLLDGLAGLPAELAQLLGPHSRLVLVGTKADLLPRNAPEQRVRSWLRARALERGVRAEQLVAVQLTGTPAGVGVAALARVLEREMAPLPRPAQAFVVGGANAGKSTLLNALAPQLKAPAPRLTSSPLPGTTIDLVAVPLPGGATLWDTPGLVRGDHLWGLLEPQEADFVLPRTAVQPAATRLQAGKTLFVGGLARLDVLRCSAPYVHVSAFVSSQLRRHIHPTAEARAPELYQRQLGRLLQPPLGPRANWPPLERHLLELRGAGGRSLSHDLSLHGAGWLSVAAPADLLLAWHLPRGLAPLHCSEALLPLALANPRVHIRKHGRVRPDVALQHLRQTQQQRWQGRV